MNGSVEKMSSGSPEETRRIGRRFAQALRAGDVIALLGEIGAGKTTFVQGLATGLDIPEASVVSPTFVLIHEYQGRLLLYHADLFRLDGMPEAANVGIEECYEAGGVTLIEWANRIPGVLPSEFLEVRFIVAGVAERIIEVISHGARYEGRGWLR